MYVLVMTGGGLTGMTAALTVLDAGGRVVLLEKVRGLKLLVEALSC
jgi:heterodisulfide reductase subunit A-like polyferredoxin